jgi:hypothetical protein
MTLAIAGQGQVHQIAQPIPKSIDQIINFLSIIHFFFQSKCHFSQK